MNALRHAREERGLSLDDVAFEARLRLGVRVTQERLRRLELGDVSDDRVDMALLMALVDFYAMPVEELAPEFAERVAKVLDLAAHIRDREDPTPPAVQIAPARTARTQAKQASRCTAEPPGQRRRAGAADLDRAVA